MFLRLVASKWKSPGGLQEEFDQWDLSCTLQLFLNLQRFVSVVFFDDYISKKWLHGP